MMGHGNEFEMEKISTCLSLVFFFPQISLRLPNVGSKESSLIPLR